MTDNEKIAKFMNVMVLENEEELGSMGNDLECAWAYIDQLQYDTSWDSLMPVVEKIEKLYSKAFPPGPEFIRMIMNKETPIDHHYMDVIAVPLATPISEVHKSVIQFIDWYNQQQTTKQ